jgi:hypothetical protein
MTRVVHPNTNGENQTASMDEGHDTTEDTGKHKLMRGIRRRSPKDTRKCYGQEERS